MTIVLNAENLIHYIRKLADFQPNHIYERQQTTREEPSCTYERNGEPSCIVGHALNKAGVPVTTLRKIDISGSAPFLMLSNTLNGENNPYDVHMKTPLYQSKWICSVQSAQDSGYTWSNAVAMADRDIAELVMRNEI